MRKLRAPGAFAVLLLFAVVAQGSRGWGGKHASKSEAKSFLASVTTYIPNEFRQSLLNRLGGGLGHRLPYRIAADSQGRIFITDPSLAVVHVLDTKHAKRWQIRGDRDHRLAVPAYIAIDGDDRIYVTDWLQSVVFVFHPDGRFMRWIGLGLLKLPTGVAVDKHNRRVYVADSIRGEILSFELDGELVQMFGSWGIRPGQLNRPLDIVLHRDTLVVLNAGNSRFELFDLQGNFRGIRPFGFDRTPIAFTVDAKGNLYSVDSVSGGLVVVDPQDKLLAGFGQWRWGQWISRRARPNLVCVALDAHGRILVLRRTLDVNVLELVTD